MDVLPISDATRVIAGSLLIAILFVEFGGLFVLRLARGRRAATGLQRAFFRAGHAHAGVLVVFSLIIQLYADAVVMDGFLGWLGRSAVPTAAILMPAGFFLSAAGSDRTTPNPLIVLIYAGAGLLALGVVSLGVSLLIAPSAA